MNAIIKSGQTSAEPITEKDILSSMEDESMWDTLLEGFTMPEELYSQIKEAQYKWHEWLDAKAKELNIDEKKIKECRHY